MELDSTDWNVNGVLSDLALSTAETMSLARATTDSNEDEPSRGTEGDFSVRLSESFYLNSD